MANSPGTQARLSIRSTSQGSKRLRRVETSKVSNGASTEAVNAVGEDSPIGFVRKPGAKTISLSVYEEQGKPEVDWEALEDSQEVFAMAREVVGGRRTQYPQCVVSKTEPDDDAEGKHMLSVEIVATTRKPL